MEENPRMPRRFQFSLRTLLIVTAVAAACVAVAVSAVRYVMRDYYTIARFDCGHNRTITIYAHIYCDNADIPRYEIRQGDDIVVPMSGTTLYFSCGQPIESSDLKLVVKDGGNLVAVVQVSTNEIALIHDFASNKSWPKDESSPAGKDLKTRLAN